MTQTEIDSLVLFRDYTLLQLKSFQIYLHKQRSGFAGGAMESYEDNVIEGALHLHRLYTSRKLSGSSPTIKEGPLDQIKLEL